MNTRGLVKELLVSYLNSKGLNSVPIRDFRKEFKEKLPNVDLYRITYGIGLKDEGFRIESDGDVTFVVID